MVMVIFRRQQRTEESPVILNVDRTEGMANCDTPVICIVMVLTRMNAWSKLSRVINLGGRFAPVTFFGSSLGANHLTYSERTLCLLCDWGLQNRTEIGRFRSGGPAVELSTSFEL